MLSRLVAQRVVVVSGPPAAGKSTLAGPLAAELGFMLIAKDRIKETLHDALGRATGPDVAWSQRLGAAAMELLWALALDAPAVVLEANFWPGDARLEARMRALGTVPVEVHCQCPIDECMRRYAERAPSRHPVHGNGAERTVTMETFARSASPIGQLFVRVSSLAVVCGCWRHGTKAAPLAGSDCQRVRVTSASS